MHEFKLGKYKHFKGNIYKAIGIAKHSETLEEYVIYTNNNQTWIRPKDMFTEIINRDGSTIPRFEYLGK